MKLFEVDDLDRYPMADALGDGMCGPTGAHIPEGQHQVGLGDDPAVPDQRSPPAVGFIVRQIFGQGELQRLGGLSGQLIHTTGAAADQAGAVEGDSLDQIIHSEFPASREPTIATCMAVFTSVNLILVEIVAHFRPKGNG